MVGQRGGPGVGGQLAVPGQEPGGQVGPAEPLQVHGQEGHVEEHVTPPVAGSELEAVEDAGAVG